MTTLSEMLRRYDPSGGAERVLQGIDPRLLDLACRWNTRLTSTAGRFRWQGDAAHSIELAGRLRREGDAAIRATLLHEVAHHLAFHAAGPNIEGHGRVWRACMAQLGEEPTRCHRYASLAPQRARRRVVARCECGAQYRRARASGPFAQPSGTLIGTHQGCGGQVVTV